jgi:hypothetical protein
LATKVAQLFGMDYRAAIARKESRARGAKSLPTVSLVVTPLVVPRGYFEEKYHNRFLIDLRLRQSTYERFL